MQHFTPLDHFITHFDQGLRTLWGHPLTTGRHPPGEEIEEKELTSAEKQLSMRLMRVNHAGEISAQGLYQGQALMARTETVRNRLHQSAREESDHLLWCQKRAKELGGRTSLLSPFWYVGSVAIGIVAAIPGDRWSLGFMAETEQQVIKHLDHHLQRLPPNDIKSKAILEKLKEDEAYHAYVATKLGGISLPKPVSWFMGQLAKVMTTTAFWI